VTLGGGLNAVAKISFGGRSIELPRNRAVRIALGVVLVLLGALGGWLPILGFWMVPLGLVVLSVDIPIVRRWRRRATVALVMWWRRRIWLRAMVANVVAWWRGKTVPESASAANGKPRHDRPRRDKAPLRDSSIVP
jgi:purine-cytosine permease-like protein